MSYNLSKLLRDVYGDLGMTETFTATDGSATTVKNGAWSVREDQPEDNYAIDYTVIVDRDSAGAGASPEGKYGRVTAYNSTTFIYTIDTVTDLIAAGDEIILCNNEIPLREMIRAINRGFEEIGAVPNAPDTSLTTAANQTEYTLPVAIQDGVIKEIWLQTQTGDSDSNDWELLTESEYDVQQGTFGSTGTLIISRQLVSGRTLKIIYDGVHAPLTAYNSVIATAIPEKLAIAAATKYALRWYTNFNEGGDDFWLQRYREAAMDFAELLISKRQVMRKIGGMPHWTPEKGAGYIGDQTIYDRAK